MGTAERYSTHVERMNESYYAWVRQMMAITSGQLTILVALKSTLVPAAPVLLWTLGATWIVLAISLLLAALILWGEHDVHARMAMAIERRSQVGEDLGGLTVVPRAICTIARIGFPWTLASSLFFLCVFALANITR